MFVSNNLCDCNSFTLYSYIVVFFFYLILCVHYAGVVPEIVAAIDPSAADSEPAQGEHHLF